MAYSINCREHIPGFSPEEVFEVGTLIDTLPTEHGFKIEAPEGEEQFAPGVIIRLGIVVAQREFSLTGHVEEFDSGEHVLLSGSSWVGKTRVWLDLADDPKRGGTIIDYGVRFKHSLATRALEGQVSKDLDMKIPKFAAGYKANVVDLLEGAGSDDPTKTIAA